MFTRVCVKEQIPLDFDLYLKKKKINKIQKYTYLMLWQKDLLFLFVFLLVFALQIQSFYVFFFLSLGHCNANLNIFPVLGNLHLWNLNHCETQENNTVNILVCFKIQTWISYNEKFYNSELFQIWFLFGISFL